jgi:hypothetical protein
MLHGRHVYRVNSFQQPALGGLPTGIQQESSFDQQFGSH